MEDKKVAKFTVSCPCCGNTLAYTEKDKSVECFACDNSFDTSKLGGSSSGAQSNMGGFSPLAAIGGFDNPESGVVFIENFFETYDWTEYYESNELFISEIAEIVKNNKVKNGANAQSWYLDFKSLAVPVQKKLEGLEVRQSEIIEKYNPEDNVDAYAAFDTYCRIAKLLVAEKEDIVKYLESAVSYAEKFNLDADKLGEIKAELAVLKGALENILIVKEIRELPAFTKAMAAYDASVAAKYASVGIDAKNVYDSAVVNFNMGNRSAALMAFENIRDYADSREYIAKINEYFSFESELFYFFGNYYIYKRESAQSPALDAKAKGKKPGCLSGLFKKRKKGGSEEPEFTGAALSLYEVVNGVPAEKPIIRGISQFIDCYNNRYYYFKAGRGIYCYDFSTKSETCIDSGKPSDYKIGGDYEYSSVLGGTGVVVKKKLAYEQKKGCLNKNKKKTDEEVRLNNYRLILVDFKSNSVRTVINEMVDIADHYGDKVFYIFAERLPGKAVKKGDGFLAKLFKKDKKKPTTPEEPNFTTCLKVCDLATGANTTVLNEDCEIHAVKGDRIIYSIWTPNALNRDLYVYEMSTQTEVLIENNVYNFFAVEQDMIYYTVGNEDFCSLVRNNYNGTERLEVMHQVSNIIGFRAGWMYVKKGYGLNAILMKISSDGKRKVIVCTQYKKAYEITASHIHYLDTYDTLRVVRTDGKDNHKIADNINWVIVNESYIYYCREEETKSKATLSLYRMDKEGNNIKKIVFAVDNAIDYDENTLYYSRKDTVRYKVTVPPEKKRDEPEVHFETRSVTRYFAFNKETEESKVVLTLGLPKGSKSFKRGCLKKKEVKEDIIYEEVAAKCAYKRKGLQAVGAVEEEQYNEVEQQNASKSVTIGGKKINVPQGGCFQKSGSGCLQSKGKKAKSAPQGGCLSLFNNKKR